jgi:Ca2+-binding RTX toxin-like protein
LHGSDGDDVLKGARGADELFGDAGADVLHGGEGADTLVGGAGADVFLFKLADVDGGDGDEILDFSSGLDVIDLANLGVSQVVTTGLTGVAGQLSLQAFPQYGITALYFDLDGDGVEDLTLRVIGLVDEGDLVV